MFVYKVITHVMKYTLNASLIVYYSELILSLITVYSESTAFVYWKTVTMKDYCIISDENINVNEYQYVKGFL